MVDISIESKPTSRELRTTIVPQAVEDLDSEPTRQHASPPNMGNLELELDDPDIFDSDLDEPTLIANESLSDPASREVHRTGEHMKSAKRPVEGSASDSALSRLPRLPPQLPLAQRPLPPPAAARPQTQPPPAATRRPQTQPPPAATRRPQTQPPPAAARPQTQPPPAAARPQTQPPPVKLPTGHSEPPPTAETGSSLDNVPGDGHKSEKWYLRVQLNTDCVADLWVRDMTPHNVLVWHEDMATWVPLLTVRELRDAIRDAHDFKTREQLRESNFVFVHTRPDAEDHQPLPKPRLPAAMETAPAPQPTSHWSQPKARTISNVPPPMLTTSVPVVGAVQSRLAEARFGGSGSTVPPVVTSIGHTPDLPHDGDWVPKIPRPSRVPTVQPYWAEAEPVEVESVQIEPVTVGGAVAAPKPRPSPPSIEAARNTAIQRVPANRSLAIAQPASNLPAKAPQPLLHLERVLWLAAGIAVASATMLVMRDGGHSSIAASLRVGETEAPTPKTATGSELSAQKSTTKSATHGDEVHHLEDLPIVGSKSSSVAAAPTKGATAVRAAIATHGKGSRGVTPESLTLASSTAQSPVSASATTPASGSFDTNAARRVLTSSASRASRCTAEGTATGSVLVTFAPTGFVQSASMSGLNGKGVNAGCVLRAFQEARVSPFAGGPVTVRKGFQIQ